MQTFIIIAVIVVVLYVLFRIFKTMLKWLLIVLAIFLAIAFFSNPAEEDHHKKLKSIRKDLNNKIKDKHIQVDDYKIFSLTKAKVKGEEKIVGIGAFGKVWYFDNAKQAGD